MRHYIIYDRLTGDILLHVKSSGDLPSEEGRIEASKENCEGPTPVESTMRVNLRTKKLERK